MNNPIDLTGAQPRYASGEEPQTRTAAHERIEEQFIPPPTAPQAPLGTPPPVDAGPPVNPYAPTGWKKRDRVEFDLTTPGGQLCRVMRLEREDLFRLNLMQYLDTFTPMLMEDAASSEASRDKKIQETIKKNPDALSNMFMAIDEVVMAATVKPKVTDNPDLVDYGTPEDWANPKFLATALVTDISMEDRMAIFAAAFGRSMDDLKSVFEQTPGVGSMEDFTGVQPPTE